MKNKRDYKKQYRIMKNILSLIESQYDIKKMPKYYYKSIDEEAKLIKEYIENIEEYAYLRYGLKLRLD